MKNNICLLSLAIVLLGCTSDYDMHGIDPKDYLAAHPLENTVDSRSFAYDVAFEPHAAKLSGDEAYRLRVALSKITPEMVESVTVELPAGDIKNAPRRAGLEHLMHVWGYANHPVKFVKSDTLEANAAHLSVAYLAIIPPDCLRWRTSPITTYSNTAQANYGCSNVSNLSQMIADPHDLIGGTPPATHDLSTRSAKVIQDYNSGKDFMPGTLGAGGGSASGGDASGSSSSAVSTGVSGLSGTGSGGR